MEQPQDYQEAKDKLSDQYWRLNNLYYIKDKQGRKVKFRFNWAQEHFYKALHYFNIILKARQLGFTTFTLIYFLDCCLFNSNHSAGVVADTRENAEDLFTNKVKFAYDNLPEWLRMQRRAASDSARRLIFNNGSSFTVGTSLRSGTYQKVLVSEYGKISAKFPEKALEIKTGALNTVDIGQQIIVESTAEGKEGEFYKLCELSQNLKNEAKPLTRLDPKFHFYAWFHNPEYRLSDKETEQQAISKEALEYLKKISGIDRNQMAWYAAKEAIQGEEMRREFPSTAEEAFEGSTEGAYYRKEMAMIRKLGHITYIPYDRRYPVYTYWDIGQSRDLMVIWYYQFIDNKMCFINFHESSDQGWEYYQKELASHDYAYGKHYWPHDGNKRIVGIKVYTSKELAEQVGIRPIEIIPRTKDVYFDIINYCKPKLVNCWFDKENCAKGIAHLDNYKRKWDTINSIWMSEHQHNEASHAADAFRTFAVAKSMADKTDIANEVLPGYHTERVWG